MGIIYLAAKPPYRPRHRRRRPLGELVTIGMFCAVTLFGVLLVTLVAPAAAGKI